MANANPIQFGAVNSAGDRDALFLKVYGGEVLTAFEETCLTQDKHMIRNITSGKSAQFPATWRVGGGYHTVGTEITGQPSNANERVIVIDDMLISDAFISNIEEAKSHYDVRSIYSVEQGRFLANAWDRNVFRKGIQAARSAATVTGAFGGTVLANNAYAVDGAALAAGVFASGQAFDEKSIPEPDRYAYLAPAQYSLVAQTTSVINRDWGGSGAYADGTVLKVSGIAFMKSVHVPNAAVTTGPATYQGDYSKTIALVMNKAAVGTVKLMDLSMEAIYDGRRQGTLMLAKYAIGTDILRPECAVEMRTV